MTHAEPYQMTPYCWAVADVTVSVVEVVIGVDTTAVKAYRPPVACPEPPPCSSCGTYRLPAESVTTRSNTGDVLSTSTTAVP